MYPARDKKSRSNGLLLVLRDHDPYASGKEPHAPPNRRSTKLLAPAIMLVLSNFHTDREVQLVELTGRRRGRESEPTPS